MVVVVVDVCGIIVPFCSDSHQQGSTEHDRVVPLGDAFPAAGGMNSYSENRMGAPGREPCTEKYYYPDHEQE